MKNPFKLWWRKSPPVEEEKDTSKPKVTGVSPGRVSVPEDSSNFLITLQGLTSMVDPSFRVEVIKLLRNLYKINPDMGIALQDMFKLANTGHNVTFPNNTDDEARKMRDHLKQATKNGLNILQV